MPRTPDRRDGPLYEEAILFDNDSDTTPVVNGELRYVQGVGFRFYEEGVEKGLTGTGISESQHRALRQLIHFIDNGPADGFASGAYRETTPTGDPFPTAVVWYTDSGKASKIVEKLISRNASKIPYQIQWKMYDSDGPPPTLLVTVLDEITYSNMIFESSRTRTITIH